MHEEDDERIAADASECVEDPVLLIARDLALHARCTGGRSGEVRRVEEHAEYRPAADLAEVRDARKEAGLVRTALIEHDRRAAHCIFEDVGHRRRLGTAHGPPRTRARAVDRPVRMPPEVAGEIAV